MVEHTRIGNAPFETLDVELGVLSKYLRAVRASAKVELVVFNRQLDGPSPWLLSQTRRADNQLARFLEVSFRTSNKQIDAPLAAELVFLPLMDVRLGILVADS